MAHKDRLKALIALGFGAVALLAATTPVAAHKGEHEDHKRVEAVEEVDEPEAVEEEADDSDDDDDDDDDSTGKKAQGGRSDKYGNPTFTNSEEADEEDDDDGVLGVGDDKPGAFGVGEDDDDDGN